MWFVSFHYNTFGNQPCADDGFNTAADVISAARLQYACGHRRVRFPLSSRRRRDAAKVYAQANRWRAPTMSSLCRSRTPLEGLKTLNSERPESQWSEGRRVRQSPLHQITRLQRLYAAAIKISVTMVLDSSDKSLVET